MAREQNPQQGSQHGKVKHDSDRETHGSDRQREHDRGYEHRTEHMDYEDVSPEQIEADIRRTRAEMDQTLEELQQRISPRGLWDEVVGIFRKRRAKKAREARTHPPDANGGAGEMAKKVGRRTLEFVRDHPVPAVLITTAVTTLIYESANRRRSKSQGASKIRSINIYRGEPTMYGGSHVHAQSGQPYREGEYGEQVGQEHQGQQRFEFGGGEESATDRAKRGAREMSSQFGEKMSHAGESVRGGVHQAGESIRGGMHQAGEAMRSGTQHVRETASNVGDQVKHGMQSAREFVEERPLTVGIGALALGLIAGLLIPRTQREDRIMGEQSEQFMQRGREIGEDVMERGKHVAEEAMEAATEAATEESERQGLKPE